MKSMQFIIVLLCLVQSEGFTQSNAADGVETVVGAFEDSLQKEASYDPLYILLRIENGKLEQRVYITNVERIRPLIEIDGIPDSYYKLSGRWIFVYSRRSFLPQNPESARKFYSDFEQILMNEDTTRFNLYPDLSYLYILSEGKLVKSREICGFPTPRFLEKGLTFDDDGNLMYRDGIYDVCNLRLQGPLFEVAPMALVNDMTNNSLISKDLSAEFIVDENGKVMQVNLKGKDLPTLSEKAKSELLELLRLKLNCGIGSINGKPVKYRVVAIL